MPHQIDENLARARECLAAARDRTACLKNENARYALSNMEIAIQFIIGAIELERAGAQLGEKTKRELDAVAAYEQEIKHEGS